MTKITEVKMVGMSENKTVFIEEQDLVEIDGVKNPWGQKTRYSLIPTGSNLEKAREALTKEDFAIVKTAWVDSGGIEKFALSQGTEA